MMTQGLPRALIQRMDRIWPFASENLTEILSCPSNRAVIGNR